MFLLTLLLKSFSNATFTITESIQGSNTQNRLTIKRYVAAVCRGSWLLRVTIKTPQVSLIEALLRASEAPASFVVPCFYPTCDTDTALSQHASAECL